MADLAGYPMRRKILTTFCATAALVGLSAALVPWWLGAALGWAGASRGLTFSRYERIGYSRFALYDAEVRAGSVRVHVARIEADTPVVALWRRGEIALERWSVDVSARERSAPPEVRGWMPLQAMLRSLAARLERWAPHVSAQAGVVRWPGAELTCASARWTERSLAVKQLAWRGRSADATLAFPGEAVRLTVRGTDGGGTWESRGDSVLGEMHGWEQRARMTARFADRGWLPLAADLGAEDIRMPGARLRLGDAYATVRGHGKISWRDEKLFAELALTGEPITGKSAPPLELTVRGQGNADAFTVESLHAVIPGVVVRLSDAVTVERSGKIRPGGARLAAEADLSQQPWFAAKGAVTVEARLVGALGEAPVVEFQLSARDVSAAGWGAALISATGELDWPQLRVSESAITGTDGEKLVVRGGWDFVAKKVLAVSAGGELRRATVARWLPADLVFQSVALSVTADGPPDALTHTGTARADSVTWGGMNPADLTLEWAGCGAMIATVALSATAGTAKISAAGAAGPNGGRLTKLELEQGGVVRLRLTEPSAVQWRPTLIVEALHLAGPEGRIDAAVNWGEVGRAELAVKQCASEWLRDFGVWRGPAWEMRSLAFTGAWARGPMTFSVKSAAVIELSEGQPAEFAVVATGGEAGLQLEELSVMEQGTRVVRVDGKIPVRVYPTAERMVDIRPDGELALAVATEPNAGFWRRVADLTGLEFKEPEVVARVAGTWARPQGTVRVKAACISADVVRFPFSLPTVEALDVELAGDVNEFRLVRMAASVEGQAVRASGRWPVADAKWREVWASPRASLQRGAEARIEVPEVAVGAFARFLPAFMAPRGRVHVDVTYREGVFAGGVQLRAGGTRPVGTLGALKEINADLALVGRTLELRSVTAQSAGQTVTLGGTVAWPDLAARTAGEARSAAAGVMDELKFDVTLKGANLPLVRQTGLLVRGDLDLRVVSPRSGPPQISGSVRLGDSRIFSDLRALVPRGVRTKARTPGSFAVELAPYRDWQLDVAVEGERFLQVRTALFNGVASGKFKLSGTLGDPETRGEAVIEQGAVKFPFATFVLQEGRVTVTPEDGAEPQLSMVGTVRRLNYDLRMEVSGAASAPVVVFTSSPPLESGQVLLMVMAGESPHDEVSFSDRQRVARLGAFLGQSLVASFGGESAIGERLSVSTGENVSRQGRETYGIEYRLSDRWSFVGEYDEFDDFNAGLKWRAYSKGGQREGRQQP